MAFDLQINGVSYNSPYLLRDSLVITESAQLRGSTMSLVLTIDNNAITPPVGGQFIKFTRDGITEFAGRIGSVQRKQGAGTTRFDYTLNCVDQAADYDTHLIQKADGIPAGLAGDAVRIITGIVGRGFTSNGVEDGPTIGKIDADYEIPTSMIQRIADSIEHRILIGYDRDVDMFYLRDLPAPIAEINIDSDINTYFDMTLDESWEQVKNRIYLTGAQLRQNVQANEPFTGDGSQKFFPLQWPPWSGDADDFGVTVDAVPQETLFDIIDGEAGDGQGSAGQIYLCIDNRGVRFPDNHPPANGAIVEIDYNYGVETATVVEDPVSIALMKERENYSAAPSDGVHEMKFNIPDLRVESLDSIVEYGQLLLARYSSVIYTWSARSWIQGWQVGQNFRLRSTRLGFDKTMYITGLTKRILNTSPSAQLEYEITAISSPFPG